ncbi:MAG: hypothetical protein P8X42_15715 [Calditrichaceae bacterium]|jgi:hypothetical protein
MENYYVSKKVTATGYHEVHKQNCPLMPERNEILYLGYFTHCTPAVQKAKDYFKNVYGCRECAKKCSQA